MADDWPSVSLGQASVTLIDCDHRTPPASETGYPYVAIPQLRNGRIDLSDVRRISREHFVDWTRKAKPTANDVVLSRRCNPGETAFVRPGLEFALGQNLVLLRADGTSVFPPFLRWLVRGPEWWAQINKFLNVGAVFDSLRCADVPKFELPLPPLSEQRAIAHILGTLDDKIELNQRMSETLEAIARALFRSWFVDFLPVRARLAGAATVHDRQLEDVFPAAFDAGNSQVPSGWLRAPLSHWADIASGGTPSKSNAALWHGQIPWISPKTMTSIHADEAVDYVADHAVGNGTTMAPVGSTLVMVRGMGLHEHVRISQARIPLAFNQDVKALIPRNIAPSLLLFSMLHMQNYLLERVESSGHGTGVLPTSVLLATEITMPPQEVQVRLSEPFENLNRRIASARNESRSLAALRDTLLPKLISGELRVKDGDRFIEREAL